MSAGDNEAVRRFRSEPLFRGVGVALLTIFDADGGLDAKASADHAVRLVELGVSAVLVAGTTGEPTSLEFAERRALLRAVRAALPPGCGTPIIAGTGGPSVRQAVTYTAAACDDGADALLVLSPPGVDDVRRYYDAVSVAASGVSVLAYHYPVASAPGISVAQLQELPIVGCKDSSGDATRFHQELASFDGWLYSGSPMLTLLAGAMGAPGVILALANLEPELCVRSFSGDVGAQMTVAESHLATIGEFPGTLKERVAARFGTSPAVRIGRDGR